MSLPLLALVFLVMLSLAYRLYGGWVARQLALDDERPTPANKVNDGVDYVPTRPFYLFAQHFSAIAAAGPIAGPILACQTWGWLPCLLWVSFGVVLIGAVHDFSSLAVSVRHGARSIADITREHLGPRAGVAMMAFIWIALVYVIVAFADITAASFKSGTEELQGFQDFNPGGAVAAASVMYLLLAIVMGVVQKYLDPPLWLVTVIFVPATLGLAWFGTKISHLLVLDSKAWALLILAYCCVASVVPVWALLQPRGYLGGFVLYLVLGLGVIGVFFGGYEISQPAFNGWNLSDSMTGSLFPFLFVTIACGACSGFHGLVCSGTTSKQVDRESHMKPVGYGAMLAEGFVALIALVTIMIATQVTSADGKNLSPGIIYGNGIGRFLTLLIGDQYLGFAVTFGAMAFSTFVFDTLDVCTRLGRYIIQELFGWTGRLGAIGGTALTMSIPLVILMLAREGGWQKFWTLFGASNQLLAALTLLSVTVWLYKARRRIWFTLFPMIFVLVITLWSLASLAINSFRKAGGLDLDFINGVASGALILLALFLALTALVKLRAQAGVRAREAEAGAGV
ncbi:MAG TPA: carbon starvation CstA family protein [Blastocatellia bacterium]|nr:carbon starvation CstA family protein [Blastocatellia bacterium]